MRALTPWTGLSTMKKEMDRVFDRFWDEDFPRLPSMGDWAPAMQRSKEFKKGDTRLLKRGTNKMKLL